jgi:hypothetical protein
MFNSNDTISYTVVPCICDGVITNKLDDTESYEVAIHKSPLGSIGQTYCSLSYPPGLEDNFKIGEFVKVLVQFHFGGPKNEFIGIAPNHEKVIIGIYSERSIAPIKIENPVSEPDDNTFRFVNKNSGAGVIATDNGQVVLVSGNVINTTMKPFGFGVKENLHYTYAQNIHRVISHNSKASYAREQFGLYAGNDINEKSTMVSPEDYLINYRRYVTCNKNPDDWISTCEGTYAPFVGANMDTPVIEKGKEVLLSKVINQKKSRITIEMGEPGDSFVNIRVDDVIKDEGFSIVPPGATTAILGNRMKVGISDKGAIDIRASGAGLNQSNKNGLHVSLDTSGNLTIHSIGIITISHGDNEKSNNSIVLDPIKGIDIKAKNGLKINDQPVVLKPFVDFFINNKTQLCQVTSIGGPAPIHPAILPILEADAKKIADNKGYTSIGVNGQKGTINDNSSIFETV